MDDKDAYLQKAQDQLFRFMDYAFQNPELSINQASFRFYNQPSEVEISASISMAVGALEMSKRLKR